MGTNDKTLRLTLETSIVVNFKGPGMKLHLEMVQSNIIEVVTNERSVESPLYGAKFL
jgi:hypothetical protein